MLHRLRVTTICKLWHTVLEENSSLWEELNLQVEPDEPQSDALGRVSFMLRRLGSLRSVTIKDTPVRIMGPRVGTVMAKIASELRPGKHCRCKHALRVNVLGCLQSDPPADLAAPLIVLSAATGLRSLRLTAQMDMAAFAPCGLIRQLTALEAGPITGPVDTEMLDSALWNLRSLCSLQLQFQQGMCNAAADRTVTSLICHNFG